MFYICTNDETLLDGTYLAHKDSREEADQISDAGFRAGQDCDCKSEPHFHDWHGGRFDQFYKRAGWVAYDDDDDPAVAAAISDAMVAERDRLDAEAEQADRDWFAELVEKDDTESVNWAFVEEFLLPGVNREEHTPASIAAALRANDPILLVLA